MTQAQTEVIRYEKARTVTVRRGSRLVLISEQAWSRDSSPNDRLVYFCRLYVDYGGTSTMQSNVLKTEAGAMRWANRILAHN